MVLSLCAERIHFFCFSSFILHALPGRTHGLRSHIPPPCPPDFAWPLGYSHLPGENLGSSQTPGDANVIVQVPVRRKSWSATHSVGQEFCPGRAMTLLSRPLSCTQTASLGSGEGSVKNGWRSTARTCLSQAPQSTRQVLWRAIPPWHSFLPLDFKAINAIGERPWEGYGFLSPHRICVVANGVGCFLN